MYILFLIKNWKKYFLAEVLSVLFVLFVPRGGTILAVHRKQAGKFL